VRIDGQTVQREVARPGVVRIPWTGKASRVRIVARDLAGNSSAPVTWSSARTREAGQ
jgi:hypothetical protein